MDMELIKIQLMPTVTGLIQYFKISTQNIPDGYGIEIDAHRELIIIRDIAYKLVQREKLEAPKSEGYTDQQIKEVFGRLTRLPGTKEIIWRGLLGLEQKWKIDPETLDMIWYDKNDIPATDE